MILAGGSVVVTGGAVRIGKAIALSLAEQGHPIGLHFGSSAAQAEETLREIRAQGVPAVSIQADLSQPVTAAAAIFEQAGQALGPIRILINSAAIFAPGTLLTTTEADWDHHLKINCKAPFFLTQQFVRQLPEGAVGCVINLLDWRAEVPVPGHAAYTVAKAGLLAQTRFLAQELGPRVRVNAIAPGAILPAPGDSSAAFQQLARKNPLQRVGSPAEIVRAVHYLLQAEFVTGEVLHVTGGEELGRPIPGNFDSN